MVFANLVQVAVASVTFTEVLTHPVGGKVTASNLSVKGKADPTGAVITVKVEDKLLFNALPSVPAFGAVTDAENVCGAFVKPA